MQQLNRGDGLQTKDKKYIECLFRNYKRNIARLKILNLNLITDDDYILSSVNYTDKLKLGNIQTSNLSSLDSSVIRREEEKKKLKEEIQITEILLDSLNAKDRLIIEAYYIDNKTQVQVANIMNVYELSTVWRNRERILNNLLDIIKAS